MLKQQVKKYKNISVINISELEILKMGTIHG